MGLDPLDATSVNDDEPMREAYSHHMIPCPISSASSCLSSLAAAALTFVPLSSPAAELQEQAEAKQWTVSASIGLSLTRGNSDTFMTTVGFDAMRDREHDELAFRAAAGYGEDDTNGEAIKTQDYMRGNGQYNRLFESGLYGGFRLEGVHDDIADINYRVTASPLSGYYFIKDGRTRLSGEIGPSYVVEEKGGVSDDYFGLRLGERFEHAFDSQAKVWQSLEIVPQVEEFENYVMNAELGISTKIVDGVGLRLVVQDTYVNQPAPGREKNDLKLVTGFSYEY